MRPGDWIEAFRPAEGAPPMRLWPFMRWSLSGAWGVLWLAAAFSALAGGMEAVTALILKLVVDTVSAASPDSYFQGANLWMLAGAAAFLPPGAAEQSRATAVWEHAQPLVVAQCLQYRH